ncbi:MAG: LuxR C-terminal-related transcriptional regulator [Pseudomonadota bacterium]
MESVRQFTESAKNAKTDKSLKQLFSKTIRGIGYHGFDAYSLKAGTKDNVAQHSNFYICDYGMDFIQSYIKDGWLQMDPSIVKLSQSSQPFEYVEFLRSGPQNSSTKWQLAALKLSNVHRAWLVPLNIDGVTRGVSCYMRGKGSSVEQRFLDTKYEIQILAGELMARLDAFYSNSPQEILTAESKADLSAREVDCLHWTARGKTNAEIGIILDVSENTVRFHLKNAFAKLGVKSRSTAVIQAAKQGVIEL